MSERNFPKRRARCTTARSSTARSTARPRPIRPRSCTRKGSSFTRCRCCPTSATKPPASPRLASPQQQYDTDDDQRDAQGLARRGRLLEYKARDRLREEHLDQRERAHACGAGEREGEKPELGGE